MEKDMIDYMAMKQARPRNGNLRGIHACHGDAVFKVLMLYPVLDPVLQNCLCESSAERNRPSSSLGYWKRSA